MTSMEALRFCLAALVSYKVMPPFPDRPTEGFFHVQVELSSMAAPSFEAGRPSKYAVELGRIIERNLRDSRAVDTEGLCIVAGTKLAATAALLHFRRPDVTVSGDEVTLHSAYERAAVPLGLLHLPISVSFAFFQEGEFVVIDPSLSEEQVMTGGMTFTLNNYKEVCAVHKAGGAPITSDLLLQCLQLAKIKAEELLETIQDAVKETQKSYL